MPHTQVAPCALCGKYECQHVYTSGFDLAAPGTETSKAIIVNGSEELVRLNLDKIKTAIQSITRRLIFDPNPAVAQAEIDKIMTKHGFPPGSIVIVDAPLQPDLSELKLTLEKMEVFKPFEMPDPESLEVHTWDLSYLETDDGTTPIPDQLMIGHTVFTVMDGLDDAGTRQAIAVGEFLANMIEEAKERRRIAELIVDSNQIMPGTADMTVKRAVRDREQLLRCVEKGYRIFFDHARGVQFLRCPGLPDINYEL